MDQPQKQVPIANKIAELVAERGWTNPQFVARCALAGIGQDTAYRMLRGDTNFETHTLRVVAGVLNVQSLSDLIDIAA